VHRGELRDLESLHDGAATADGVIHTANLHDFSDLEGNARTDLRAIETLGATLAGSDRPFVVTSAVGLLEPGRVVTEEDAPYLRSGAAFRIPSELAALSMAGHGIRVSVVRLPLVHGEDDHGFVPEMINAARAQGASAYIGEGKNRWAAVHRLDAARLYRLAVEAAPAGSRLHGAGEQGVPFRDIAEAIGRHLEVPVVSVTPEEAGDHFGFLAAWVATDNPTSSALTQELLGWRPEGPELIPDIDQGHYFEV
jgi:nucleoside-diphosphate-sugar epimerase